MCITKPIMVCFVSQCIGLTALISASHAGHLEVVKSLLAAGADMEAKDNVSA